MRRFVLVVMVALLCLGGCMEKKEIDPSRYSSTKQSQPSPDTSSTAQPLEEAPQVQESSLDEQPAPPPTTANETGVEPAPAATPAPYYEQEQPVVAPAPHNASTLNYDLYTVVYQVGSFADPLNAQNLKQRLEGQGFDAAIQQGGANRVIAGYRGDVVESRQKLMNEGVMDPLILKGPGKAAPTAQQQPSVGGPVTFQVGSFAGLENAVNLQNMLNENGLAAHVMKKQLPQGAQYRVLAEYPGPEEDGRAKLMSLGVVDPIVYHGSAPNSSVSPTSASPAAAPAAPAPVSPSTDVGMARFQVGVFSDLENAEQHKHRLMGKGFDVDIELIDDAGKPKYRVIAGQPGSPQDVGTRLERMGFSNPIYLP